MMAYIWGCFIGSVPVITYTYHGGGEGVEPYQTQ